VDDVLLNKAGIIERCLRRVREEYAGDPSRLRSFTHQDAIVLNLERACQAAIDLAMHLVARGHLGVPQDSKDAFVLLERAGALSTAAARRMTAMVGFRNVAVHEYQTLDIEILRDICETRHLDFVDLCAELGLKIVP